MIDPRRGRRLARVNWPPTQRPTGRRETRGVSGQPAIETMAGRPRISVRVLTRDNSISVEFDPWGFSIKDLRTKMVLL
jgi:hypothetical protein